MPESALDWADQLSRLLDRAPSAEALAAQDDAALIDLIAATERAKGRLAAAQARAEAAFWDAQIGEQQRQGVPRGQRGRGIADQVALARRITPKQASDEVALHRVLLGSLPRTSELLEAGEISEYAARRIAENVLVLEEEDRTRVDIDLADQLPSVTARRAGDLARARAQELDADAAVRRHQRAVADRRVSLQPAVDGMSILRAALPVKDGVAVLKVLTEAARSAKSAGDPRTKGQIMADTLTARACGLESPDDIPVEIQLLMTDMTLLADEEATAWIDGLPLPGRVARDLALGVPTLPPPAGEDSGGSAPNGTTAAGIALTREADGVTPQAGPAAAGSAPPGPADDEVRDEAVAAARGAAPPPELSGGSRWIWRLYADAGKGDLTGVDARRRLFRGQVRRFILLRDQRCRTPWCDAPIHDIDHAHRFADGGSTDADNGIGHCQRFNLVKEMPGWESSVDPASDDRGHRLTIRTPTGHTYQSTSPLLRRLLDGEDGARAEILADEPVEDGDAPDPAHRQSTTVADDDDGPTDSEDLPEVRTG